MILMQAKKKSEKSITIRIQVLKDNMALQVTAKGGAAFAKSLVD